MTRPAPVLTIEHLRRHFGALAAVNGVSLSVAADERRAIIGPNGAGKTTLFNLITGQIGPSAGRIAFDGAAITGLPPHAVARRGISRSCQRTNLFPRLSVLENLRLAAWADRIGAQPWERAFVFFKHEDEGKGPELAKRLVASLPT